MLFAFALLCGGAARVAARLGAHDAVVATLIVIAVAGAVVLLITRITHVLRGSAGRPRRR